MDSCSVIMADSLPDLQYCLPTEFFTEIDRVIDFPIDFPYEFDSSGLADSTETESSDEDDSAVGLTRSLIQQLDYELKKNRTASGSPKSTLCGIGGWSMSRNGGLSPPTTPLGTRYDKSEPIYAGAGDVLRLKNGVSNQTTGIYSSQGFVYGVSQLPNQDQLNRSYSVWGTQQLKAESPHLPQNQIQNRGTSTAGYQNGRFVRPLGLPQSAWPPLQVQKNKHRSPASSTPAFLSGSGVKSCAGTGVFLPRRFNDSVHIKKSAKVEDIDRRANSCQSLNGAFASKHDHASIATTKSGLLAQHKSNLQTENAVKNEICLPQEWIY
ncbi:uncharacterized protein [Euphorbia lathyris]|uniref:uncharacterized protein n=1 Tax=Euphorbia lathyris TaxID=212925 RepID=UPI0033133410